MDLTQAWDELREEAKRCEARRLEYYNRLHKAKKFLLKIPEEDVNPETIGMLESVLAAIDAQLPKKVLPLTNLYDAERYNCPMCERFFSEDNAMGHVPYCSICGQALDWSAVIKIDEETEVQGKC